MKQAELPFSAPPKRRRPALVAACEEARAAGAYPVKQALAELDPRIDEARSALLGLIAARPETDEPSNDGPTRELAIEQNEDDGEHHTLARYWRQEPSHTWPALGCYVYAALRRSHDKKAPRWLVEAQCEFPCRSTQWNFVHTHPTREEAATEAAAFVLEAERLFSVWRPDVKTVAPAHRQHEAWLAYVREDARWKKADSEETAALAAYDRLSAEDDFEANYEELRGLSRRRNEARDTKRRLEEPPADGWEEKRSWLKANPWTGFL